MTKYTLNTVIFTHNTIYLLKPDLNKIFLIKIVLILICFLNYNILKMLCNLPVIQITTNNEFKDSYFNISTFQF